MTSVFASHDSYLSIANSCGGTKQTFLIITKVRFHNKQKAAGIC